MDIKYITMFKDYQHGRQKGIRKFANTVEEKLICTVCIEKMSIDSGNIRGLDLVDTQTVWNLL